MKMKIGKIQTKHPLSFSHFLGYHNITKSAGPLLFLFFLLLLFFNIEGLANEGLQIPPHQTRGLKRWCVAKPSASEEELKANTDYACNVLSDCNLIQPGGSCADPDALINHASVIMNSYYALNGRNTWNCNFTNSALIVVTDPSYNSCKYA